MPEVLIKFGGLFHMALAIFHLSFWKLFNWPKDLMSMSTLNRAVMQVLNICLTAVFFLFAYISIVHSHALISTSLGNSVLNSIALFWLMRIVLQFIYFKNKHWQSWLFIAVLLLGLALYIYPVLLIASA